MDIKRKISSDFEESNSQKRRKLVSPVKCKHFNPLEQCRKMCNEFRTDTKHYKYAQFFMIPVDPVALNIPLYFDVIKNPIDLSTIQSKFDNNEYKSEDDFAFDMRLMFENCYLFNGRDHQIAPFCQIFQETFEEKFSRIKKAKEKSKFTIFEKLDQKEAVIRNEVAKHKLLLEDLMDKLQGIAEQRKEEESKLRASEAMFPIEEPQKKVKKIKTPKEPAPKLKKKTSKEKKPKKLPPPSQNQQQPSPQKPVETKPIVKSDSEEDDTAQSMTYEEMRTLTSAINKLPQAQVLEVVKIIQKHQPELVNAKGDELDIEFQSLKPITLRSLEKFVQEVTKPKPVPKPALKGKTMRIPQSSTELEKQKKTLQTQLQTIDSQLGIGSKKKAPPPPPPVEKQSSSTSDSDSDGSSSSSSSSSCPSSASLATSSDDDKK